MRKRVYIETTIPSFCYETRRALEMVARRNWTRPWWKSRRAQFELVTSLAVIEELQLGNHPNKAAALRLVADLPLVPVEKEIGAIVNAYVAHHVMPANPKGDALRLALAAFHLSTDLCGPDRSKQSFRRPFLHRRASSYRETQTSLQVKSAR